MVTHHCRLSSELCQQFAPLLDVIFFRSKDKSDVELDALGENVISGVQLLAQVHNALSTKRRELLKPQLAPVYALTLTNPPDSASQEWLYGGNLEEITKQCEVSRKIGDKVGREAQASAGERSLSEQV